MAPNLLFWRLGSGGLLLVMAISLASTRPVYADGNVDIASYKFTDANGKLQTVFTSGNSIILPIAATQNDIQVFVMVANKQGGDTCPATITKSGGTPIDLSDHVTGVANGFKVIIPANTMGQNSNWTLTTPVKRSGTQIGTDSNAISIPPP